MDKQLHITAYVQQTLKANWYYLMAELSDAGSLAQKEFYSMAKFHDCVAVEHIKLSQSEREASSAYTEALRNNLSYTDINLE